jgi:uncharacterized protein YdaU (DUF1376 family)
VSKPDLWMPLYIADYLADTTHLSTEAHGAYLLLLMSAWMGGGELPNSDEKLMRICRADKRGWQRIKDDVLSFFFVDEDKLIQPRLKEEYEHAVSVNNAQKRNGALGGRPKKVKPDETQHKPTGFNSVNPIRIPNESPPQSPPPTPKPSVMDTSTELSNVPDSVCAESSPGLACKAMREMGIPDGNPAHPTLIALCSAGATVGEFQHAARAAIAKGKASFSYVIGIVKRQREEAATLTLHKGQMPNKQEAIETRNRSVADDWVPPEMEVRHANA